MTDDDILKIARDCGVEIAGMPHYQPQLARFAAAVELATLGIEREACAVIAENFSTRDGYEIAHNIRAR